MYRELSGDQPLPLAVAFVVAFIVGIVTAFYRRKGDPLGRAAPIWARASVALFFLAPLFIAAQIPDPAWPQRVDEKFAELSKIDATQDELRRSDHDQTIRNATTLGWLMWLIGGGAAVTTVVAVFTMAGERAAVSQIGVSLQTMAERQERFMRDWVARPQAENQRDGSGT